MKTKKIRILTMLMAIVFLSGGLVFGEVGVSEADCSSSFVGVDDCDTNFGGVYGQVIEGRSTNDWCRGGCLGGSGDCNPEGPSYSFCEGGAYSGGKLYHLYCECSGIANAFCNCDNVVEEDCPSQTQCLTGITYNNICSSSVAINSDPTSCVESKYLVASCVSDSNSKFCDDSATGCCANYIPGAGFKCFDDDVPSDGVKETCRLEAVVTHKECSGLNCIVVNGAGIDQCGGALPPCSCACTDDNPDCCGGPACLPAGDNDCSCSALGGILCSAGIGCTGSIVPNHSDSGVCCDGICQEKWACSTGTAIQCVGSNPTGNTFNCSSLNGDECAPGKEWVGCDNSCAVDNSCITLFDNADNMPDACGCSCDSAAPVCGDADGICPAGCTNLLDPDCPAAGCNNNGTQDNGETGIDCGGGGCPACGGPGCNNNGTQDNGETGIDCGGGGCPACGGPVPPDPASACDPNDWFFCNPLRGSVTTLAQGAERVVGYILGLIGSIALLLIIISGAMYMTAGGSEEKATTAKKVLTGAVIGLGIALLAFSLLQVVIGILNA